MTTDKIVITDTNQPITLFDVAPGKITRLIITAGTTNSDIVYIGNSNIDSSIRLGQPLRPREKLTLQAPWQFGVEEGILGARLFVVGTAGDYINIAWLKPEFIYTPAVLSDSILLEEGVYSFLLTEDEEYISL
jgi:hypothetical protein